MIQEIKAFLNGDSSFIVKRLNEKMELASNSLNFEKAIEYKEMINDINITLKNQVIVLNNDYNFDLFNCYSNNNYLSITVFFIRNGTLFGREKKIINTFQDEQDALLEYIIKFYEKNLLPKKIIVPSIIDTNLLGNYLNINIK